MRLRNDDVIVHEARVGDRVAVGLEVGDALFRLDLFLRHAPVKHEVARSGVERDVDFQPALEHLRAGRERDVERVAHVAVMRGASARQFARHARLQLGGRAIVAALTAFDERAGQCDEQKDE